MDILRRICSVVPDGMTKDSLMNSISLAFVYAIEKDIILTDFTQDQIATIQPVLVSAPECHMFPVLPFVVTILDMVPELDAFWGVDLGHSTNNSDGKEYSTLVRNMVAGEFSDSARRVGESVDNIWKDVKNTYPRYYRSFNDDVLFKVFIGEDGEKMCSVLSRQWNVVRGPFKALNQSR